MPDAAQPRLVRYWKDGYQSDPITAFVDWEQQGPYAQFFVKPDHVLTPIIQDVPTSTCLLTVYSTDELEWSIHTAETGIFPKDGFVHGTRFSCVERRKKLRDSLISDDYLVEAWLMAEKEYETGETDA
jgi:hypothetical protein